MYCKKNSTLASSSVKMLKLRANAKSHLTSEEKAVLCPKVVSALRKTLYNIMPYYSKIRIFLHAVSSPSIA